MNQRGVGIVDPSPWSLRTEQPYVLSEDRLAVEVFNSTADASHRIHTESPPEPFLGHPDAPIVVLLLNPGTNVNRVYYLRLLS